jgi:hypothetical protein
MGRVEKYRGAGTEDDPNATQYVIPGDLATKILGDTSVVPHEDALNPGERYILVVHDEEAEAHFDQLITDAGGTVENVRRG